MSQLALAHDALLPRAPGGQAPGAALSLAVHLGLVAALTISIDWRAQTPEVFSAELWASVPQAAAPAPVAAPLPPPPPAPRIATPPTPPVDIAVEREKPRKPEPAPKPQPQADTKKLEAERKRADAERKRADDERKLAEQQEREEKANDERLARQRDENLRRMMGQAGPSANTGAAAGTGTAAQSAGPSAAYAGKVIAMVRPNIVFTGTVPGNPATEVEVRAAPGGSIIARHIVKKSGHPEWDEAVLRAIDKTSALPRDTDGRVPQTLIIAFRRD